MTVRYRFPRQLDYYITPFSLCQYLFSIFFEKFSRYFQENQGVLRFAQLDYSNTPFLICQALF
jgi:hypothetical protein